MVCPYSLTSPGGVQAHVLGLARGLRGLGHQVEVLAPAGAGNSVIPTTPLPEFVTSAGRSVGVPYNGSVAPLAFGPVALNRVRRWMHHHDFDVLHLHEPVAPSLSLIALALADRPVVATFHFATSRSWALAAAQGLLQPTMEKITARIAVSPLARRVQVEYLGGDAVEIPNGLDVPHFADAQPLTGYPRAGGTVGFVGRYGEPRKGMPVLLAALRTLVRTRPELCLLVVGHGDAGALLHAAGPELASRIHVLGALGDAGKAAALRSMDVLCVPALGGESFGIVLTEGMAAGTPVVASDLPAFRLVLDEGRAGVLSATGSPAALSAALADLLDDPERRAELAAAGRRRAAMWDWPVVARRVAQVYDSAVAADPRRLRSGAGRSSELVPVQLGSPDAGCLDGGDCRAAGRHGECLRCNAHCDPVGPVACANRRGVGRAGCRAVPPGAHG
jgi:phosphatidyl-myo-inositol alpha-mannosyltransferase